MPAARIIPCLDVRDGRVVKGVGFVDLVDAGDPVEQAGRYDAAGADELCFLDITASHENRATLYDVVARTAERCFMPLTVGGGVRAVEDIRILLKAGADKVSINTAAVQDPELISRAAEKFGCQCITVALDLRFLAPARPGDLVVARGHVVRQTVTLAFLEGRLTVDARDVAAVTAILSIRQLGQTN